MRLIDANALLQKNMYGNTESIIKRTYAEELIREAPTIEAEPAKHGRWRLNNDGSGTCSECHFTQKNVWDMDNWQNYCGVCGAKMDKEGE